MRFKYTTKNEAMQWHKKFLWTPTRVGGGNLVWLETVWRRCVASKSGPYGYAIYEYAFEKPAPPRPPKHPPRKL